MLTIGHSTLPLDTFLRILARNGVSTLADIRTIPKSRYNPQFARESLSRALADRSIAYCWFPSLGGLRKPLKDRYLNAGWVNPSFRGYADYMQTPEFAAGLDALLALAPQSATAIMCAEAVPWRCHRSLVADALEVRGLNVSHILYDKHGVSQRRPHSLTRFAQTEGTRIWYPAEKTLFPDEDLEPGAQRAS
jgi:uncharacterized protein (DUF488 family)